MLTQGLTNIGEWELIDFGPDLPHWGQLTLPAEYERDVVYVDRNIKAAVTCTFREADERVKLVGLNVETTDRQQTLTPNDVIGLEVGDLVTQVSSAALRLATNRPIVPGPPDPDRRKAGPTADNLELVARIYWSQYAIWGKPRAAIIDYFDISRTTANVWIRRARDEFGLPGAHSHNED